MAELSLVKSALRSAEQQSLERLGWEYFEKILKNIKVMLDYINENGIVIPDDLTAKISALYTGAEAAPAVVPGNTANAADKAVTAADKSN